MIPAGQLITVVINGHPRAATVDERPGLGSGHRRAFVCTLEADPALGLPTDTAVVLLDTEGVYWIRGWGDAEATGALLAAYALMDRTPGDEALLLETAGRRRP